MGKKPKTSQKNRTSNRPTRNGTSSFLTQLVGGDSYRRNLLLIPFTALVIKLILILRIEAIAWPGIDPTKYRLSNFWMGADGENYVKGLEALVRDGVFSPEGILNYWPAGYPLLLWTFGLPFRSWTLVSTGIIQTIVYALAAAYFVDALTRTRLKRFSAPIALLLAFNPTLSFNSYAIGYESLVAAILLVAVTLVIKDFKKGNAGVISKEGILAALAISLTSFMQPRMIVSGLVIFLVWALATRTKLVAAGFFSLLMAISLVFPAFLVARNMIATDQASISTNLGVTMRIGAGSGASGGYANGASPLECPTVPGTASEQDNAVVRCVINWYLDNPSEVPGLFARKSLYYWSPWFGPLANGTMARNPWAQNHPLKSTAQTQEGYDFVFGTIGKVISWAWVLGTLGFLGLGFWVLWRLNGVERLLGITALGIILINMAVSMATIGDHRFRLPAAGLSLLLQGIGLVWALGKGKKRVIGQEEKLLWKSFQRTTNLPT